MNELGPGWGEPRTRALTWHDPVAAAAAGARLSGADFLHAIAEARLPPPPFLALVGARLTHIGDGEVTFACTPDESHYNLLGFAHGGVLCTLLDSAAGCALHTTLAAGVGYTSVEIKVSFMRPVRAGNGELTVTGTLVKGGRRVAFAEAQAHDGTGALVGTASSTLLVAGP